jgi:predicted kinase
LDFYKSYRACVRAKVAALRAEQLAEKQAEATVEAGKHLALADQYAAPWLRPSVFAVGGLAGTGKTTLATALAEALSAELIRTDVVRQQLFGSDSHAAAADTGVYRREAREHVYDEMFRQARSLCADQISVVLDGTFSTRDLLAKAKALSSNPRSSFLAIECVCRPEIAQQRIVQRLAKGRDASEARPEIHELQRARWESWPPEVPHIRVDTEQPLNSQVDQTIAKLRTQCEHFETDDP